MQLAAAIVGRPNVGKSTLFNRLAGRKTSIVHDTPGVTRDWQEAVAQWGPLSLRLIDTAGFEKNDAGSLAQRMTEGTLAAIANADLALFVFDARDGITPGDREIADALRRTGKPVIFVANKCENRRNVDLTDAMRMGFGEPITISAEHGVGMEELFDAMAPFATKEDDDPTDEGEPDRPLKLAIVGRPNVGKSSLFNRLLGEERSLTGPEAGITRDSIAAHWQTEGRSIILHDTAGLRKRARSAGEHLEQSAIESTLNAVRFAECVIVVIDATASFEKQDLTISDLVAREGRAIVFAVNKWDMVAGRKGAVGELRERQERLLPQVAGAPLVAVSALTGEGVSRLLPAVVEADRAWNTRAPTGELNRFLARALERHPPPAIRGRRVRIRYMTQAKTRPPTFALFGTQLGELPQSYLRYLQNELREAFGLKGVPIRFSLRTSRNPYVD